MGIRIGDIRFLNSWPVTYALREGKIPTPAGESELAVVSGAPTELNRKLLTGELDAGAVSSMLFLRHQEEFVPVPGFCIRSDGGISSVLVVSHQPLEEIKGRRIGVTNQGATTPVLLKLLLNRRRLKAEMEVTALRYPEILSEYPAALLIGDEALQATQGPNRFATWDLGEQWTEWTRTPFVYALWVVRRTLVEERPGILEEIARRLRSSLEWGRGHQREIILRMQGTFPWQARFLRRYLERLSYDLDARAWEGLKRFAREARELKEVPASWRAESARPMLVGAR